MTPATVMAIVLGLEFTAAAAAPQIFVSLDYQVPPTAAGCADANGFRDSVQQQLGYDPFRAQADRRVTVRVSRSEGGYDGRIQWADTRGRSVGERKLSARHPGCAEIVNNLAFAVAVQIQLLAAVAPPAIAPPPPAEPSISAPHPPSPTGTASPAREDDSPSVASAPERPEVAQATRLVETAPPSRPIPPPKSQDLRLSIGLGPSLALALAPRPTTTGRLFADGRVSWFSFELSFDGAWPVQQVEATGAGFSFHRFAAEGAACGHSRIVGFCITGGLGRLQARGLGVNVPRTAAGFSAQTGVRFVATQALGARYFAAVRVEGIALLSRWTVNVNELPVWTTPRLAALIGVDVGARIF